MPDYLSPEAYLPHRPPMMLLQKVHYVDNQQVKCSVHVAMDSPVGPFLDQDKTLPAWFGVELIAQTIGVWSGWQMQQKSLEKIPAGMLLGVRKYTCAMPSFSSNITLDIQAHLLLEDEQIGSFEGTISDNLGVPLAQARMTVLRPTESQLHQILGIQ